MLLLFKLVLPQHCPMVLDHYPVMGSCYLSQEEIDEKAFKRILNGDEIPQRAQGYGFGVKKSDDYGVYGLLEKEGCRKIKERSVVLDASVRITDLKKKNEELEKQNKKLSNQLSENNMLLKNAFQPIEVENAYAKISLVLDAVQFGDTSPELIDVVKSSFNMPNQSCIIFKVEDDAIHDDGAT